MMDLVFAVINWIGAHGLELIGAAAILAKLTPWTEDDEIVGKIQKLLNFVGLRAGYQPPSRDE